MFISLMWLSSILHIVQGHIFDVVKHLSTFSCISILLSKLKYSKGIEMTKFLLYECIKYSHNMCTQFLFPSGKIHHIIFKCNLGSRRKLTEIFSLRDPFLLDLIFFWNYYSSNIGINYSSWKEEAGGFWTKMLKADINLFNLVDFKELIIFFLLFFSN